MSSLRDIFDVSVGSDLQRQFVRLVFSDYERAWKTCDELFEKPEKHDTLGVVRRALIEQDWRGICRRAEGVTATPELNIARTSHHTRVTAGRVFLTQSAVDSPSGIVRPAEFRRGYAHAFNLSFLEDFGSATKDQAQAPVYAVLLHGPDPRNKRLPGFITIAFPDPEWSAYVDRISLMQRFDSLVDELRGVHTETVQQPEPRLRRDVKRNPEQQIGS